MSDDSVVLGELAEEFSARVRAGQLPDLEEYAARHPGLAGRIRALFPHPAAAGGDHDFHRIALADARWHGNDVGRADQLLDDCPADLRGWGWRYLKRLCHADLRTCTARAPIHAIAVRPDGRRVASGSWDGVVEVWGADAGGKLLSLGGHDPSHAVRAVTFSPNGRLLASAGWDGTVRLWDARGPNR